MKTRTILLIAICLLVFPQALRAELILEESFDYPSERPLVSDAVASSDNFDGVTGWSTQSSKQAGVNCFDLVEEPLYYEGYESSGTGSALKYNGNVGQGVFKIFEKPVTNDATVYISFLINFSGDVKVTGGDYFLGIKMENSAESNNWGGRLYASVNPVNNGSEVSLGINKMSGGTTTWTNQKRGPFFAANTTHLMVIKYKVGVLNGKSAEEEAGNYDDEMHLFVNPALDGKEPDEPLLTHIDPAQNDIYRYTASGLVFGGARGIYLRSSNTGTAPAYIIDGIRVGQSWEDVLPWEDTGLKKNTADEFSCTISGKQIIISSLKFDYSMYEIISLSGQKVQEGNLDGNRIDASGLTGGMYILNLKGNQSASVKIIIN